jgi:molybdenum cofactor biosynthesis enzyme MoaA
MDRERARRQRPLKGIAVRKQTISIPLDTVVEPTGGSRVHLTCTGKLYLYLGQDDAADLRAPLLASPHDDEPVTRALVDAIARKPKGHDFVIERARPATVRRHMSVTGG